eukprot:2121655-Amphidinium_carterae.1
MSNNCTPGATLDTTHVQRRSAVMSGAKASIRWAMYFCEGGDFAATLKPCTFADGNRVLSSLTV